MPKWQHHLLFHNIINCNWCSPGSCSYTVFGFSAEIVLLNCVLFLDHGAQKHLIKVVSLILENISIRFSPRSTMKSFSTAHQHRRPATTAKQYLICCSVMRSKVYSTEKAIMSGSFATESNKRTMTSITSTPNRMSTVQCSHGKVTTVVINIAGRIKSCRIIIILWTGTVRCF